MSHISAKLLAVTLATFLVGCATTQRPQKLEPVPAQRAPARVAAGAALPPAAYIAAAASIDLFEIRSSELALRRSTTGKVRDFASMMIAAHQGTSGQLSLAGRRLNLLPPATLAPKYQAMMDDLTIAPDFDSIYKRQQIAVHREALAVHTNFAARGSSPTLRPVAAAIAPIIERHLRLLTYL